MTSKEFAKLIGVSQPTVSRALNNSDLVPEEKKNYIIQKAKEYGFELNSQAKSLRTKRTNTIGILFPKHFKGLRKGLMLAKVYDWIQAEMSHYDYDIMVVYYDKESSDFSSFERIIRRRKVDGFLVLRMELSDSEVSLIERNKIPCVFMMNAGSNVRDNLNYLFSDSTYGGYLAGKYLGRFPEYHKLFMSVKEENSDSKRRLGGFRQGLAECGYTLKDEDILRCNMDISGAYECAMENIDRFRKEKTAVLAYSDLVAIGALQAMQTSGIAVPDQVQIMGMDDITLASSLHPMLSTVHVEVEEIVPRACKLLMNLIEKKEDFVQEWIKPHLVLRETTR